MKIIPLIPAILLVAAVSYAQPTPQQYVPIARPSSGAAPGSSSAGTSAVKEGNYLIRVEWKEPKAEKKFLEVLTTVGQFSLDTIQKNPVKINNNDIPVTLKFTGTLDKVTDQNGRLSLFLGRTVPYVTGNSPNGGSSYSQMSVGLSSTVIVTFGKPEVLQNDESGEISVLVTRMTD